MHFKLHQPHSHIASSAPPLLAGCTNAGRHYAILFEEEEEEAAAPSASDAALEARARDRALGARGWAVLSIPVAAWQALGGDEERQASYLAAALAAARLHAAAALGGGGAAAAADPGGADYGAAATAAVDDGGWGEDDGGAGGGGDDGGWGEEAGGGGGGWFDADSAPAPPAGRTPTPEAAAGSGGAPDRALLTPEAKNLLGRLTAARDAATVARLVEGAPPRAQHPVAWATALTALSKMTREARLRRTEVQRLAADLGARLVARVDEVRAESWHRVCLAVLLSCCFVVAALLALPPSHVFWLNPPQLPPSHPPCPAPHLSAPFPPLPNQMHARELATALWAWGRLASLGAFSADAMLQHFEVAARAFLGAHMAAASPRDATAAAGALAYLEKAKARPPAALTREAIEGALRRCVAVARSPEERHLVRARRAGFEQPAFQGGGQHALSVCSHPSPPAPSSHQCQNKRPPRPLPTPPPPLPRPPGQTPARPPRDLRSAVDARDGAERARRARRRARRRRARRRARLAAAVDAAVDLKGAPLYFVAASPSPQRSVSGDVHRFIHWADLAPQHRYFSPSVLIYLNNDPAN